MCDFEFNKWLLIYKLDILRTHPTAAFEYFRGERKIHKDACRSCKVQNDYNPYINKQGPVFRKPIQLKLIIFSKKIPW